MNPRGERTEQERRSEFDRQRGRPGALAAGSAPGARGKRHLPGGQQLLAAVRAAAWLVGGRCGDTL